MSTIQNAVLDRIRSQGRGKVFIPKDFLDLGSRGAADQSLSRLVKSGDILRLGRGLYHYPQMNERLGIPLGPDLDEIADALARQTGSRVIPSGAVAENRLTLSTISGPTGQQIGGGRFDTRKDVAHYEFSMILWSVDRANHSGNEATFSRASSSVRSCDERDYRGGRSVYAQDRAGPILDARPIHHLATDFRRCRSVDSASP